MLFRQIELPAFAEAHPSRFDARDLVFLVMVNSPFNGWRFEDVWLAR
jgi:hypothetical protein